MLSLEKVNRTVRCPHCGSSTDKLHQNNPLTIRDISWGEQQIYLKVNRRVMRCDRCEAKFREELGLVQQKRNYTERFKTKIIQEVIENELKNVAQRNDVSEQEIETMLQGVVEGINNKLKLIKRRGYGFRNFDNFSFRCFITWHFSVDFTS